MNVKQTKLSVKKAQFDTNVPTLIVLFEDRKDEWIKYVLEKARFRRRIFIKEKIPSPNTHERPFMYNFGLNYLHVNFKLIKKLGLYNYYKQNELMPPPPGGFRISICYIIFMPTLSFNGFREGVVVRRSDPPSP